MKFEPKKDIKRFVVICIASVLMAVNIKTFVRTGDLYPGGATGLTILLQTIFDRFFGISVPYTAINLLLNAFPVYIGFRFIGRKFTLFSCLMIVLTSILTDIIPAHVITYDVLLISIFGGILNGFAISMCLMVGATSGGTDFISIYLSEKKGVDSWNLILGLNIVIISIAGVLFGWDKALYSIIFQFAATQVLHALYTRYQKRTLFIVTKKPEEISDAIYTITNHGATILEGEGSYEHCERNVVYSIVAKDEVKKVLRAVREIDENAFANEVKTEGLSGHFYQKPND
ncbi:MAG: YitT family protein [Lachnospiraceae bacterium]|nr:YitT family protein [Lachnospiraceae bacterium]